MQSSRSWNPLLVEGKAKQSKWNPIKSHGNNFSCLGPGEITLRLMTPISGRCSKCKHVVQSTGFKSPGISCDYLSHIVCIVWVVIIKDWSDIITELIKYIFYIYNIQIRKYGWKHYVITYVKSIWEMWHLFIYKPSVWYCIWMQELQGEEVKVKQKRLY